MTSENIFIIKGPQIVHEKIENEVIIINLESGIYYSLTGMGAEIWSLIEKKASMGQMVNFLMNRYDASPEDLQNGTVELLNMT